VSSTPNSSRLLKLAAIAAVYCAVVYLVPRPETVKPEGWRLLGIFCATIAGLILEPVPQGALVLAGVTASALLGGLTPAQALSGYADPPVWLLLSAFFISRALIDTGLARRMALVFIRLFGRNSLGVSYALGLTDMVLAAFIPSNGARSGGVVLPIVRSISELYGSTPGPTANILGRFLVLSVYQSVCITSAMFYTGQASNPLAAEIGTKFGGQPVTWTSWAIAGIVPGLASLLLVPLVIQWIYPPTVRQTPEAAGFAREELEKMGRPVWAEKVVGLVFGSVCLVWLTYNWHGVDITITALTGVIALLLTGALSWEQIRSEKAGWALFIWYGGLTQLGKSLATTGIPTEFAKAVGGLLGDLTWEPVFAVTLLVYYYAHYGFASITAHLLAMYPAFLAVLAAKGAPVGLMVYAFACFANLAAGLTNYGTTPAPLFFGLEYVSMRTWWVTGAVISVMNILIWSTLGFAWWHLLGIW